MMEGKEIIGSAAAGDGEQMIADGMSVDSDRKRISDEERDSNRDGDNRKDTTLVEELKLTGKPPHRHACMNVHINSFVQRKMMLRKNYKNM